MGLTPRDMEHMGYYSVGSRMYFHKYEALDECSKHDGLKMRFHWEDDFWGAQNWLTEPKASLRELYRKRAEQLRDKYQYIILCLSGGADSENILRTFDENNLPLDEIVSWHDVGLSGDRASRASAEIFKVAIPLAQRFCEKHPHTRHTILDAKEPLIEVIGSLSVEDLLLTYLQTMPSMGTPMRAGGWFYSEPRYRKLVDEGRSVCILWGVDKTLIHPGVNGRYHFSFNDDFTKRNRKNVLREPRVTDEFFYWSVDHPQLLIKQCHTLLRNINALAPGYVDEHPVERNLSHPTFAVTRKYRPISLKTINKWLYGWDASTFSMGKPRWSLYLSELDGWVEKYQHEDATKKWASAMHHARSKYEHLKMKPVALSQPYFVEARAAR